MSALSAIFIRIVWRRKSSLLGLLATTTCLGVFARLTYEQYLYLQAQNVGGLSVFNELLLPLAGLTIICQLTMSLLSSVQLSPSIRSSGQGSLLDQASIKPLNRVGVFVAPVVVMAVWPIVNFTLIAVMLSFHTQIDLVRLIVTIFGLLLINLITGLIILAVSLNASKTLPAIIQSVLLIALISGIETGLSVWWPGSSWIGLFLPFFALREGVLVYADIVGLFGWFIAATSLCYLVISKQLQSKRLRPAKKLSQIICLAGMVLFLTAGHIPGQLDLTVDQRSSLSRNIADQLALIGQPIMVSAIIDEQSSREEIKRGFQIIQRALPQSTLEFQSRQSLAPQLYHVGEYIQISVGDLQQSIAYPFEQPVKAVFESAMRQMLMRKNTWITFVEGHREASPFAVKSSDLGGLYEALTATGWPVAAINLSKTDTISDNTGLLVIASSLQQWLPGEEEIVLSYLKQGGNLLLFADPESVIPPAIEDFIGISRYPGTLVDWNGYQGGTPHPAIIIVNEMSEHPIVNHLNSLLAFPWSSGLKQKQEGILPSITFAPVLQTHSGVWSEFNISEEALSFDQALGELQQSFVVAMSRFNSQNQQKIVVVGDSHFASDSAINNYANKPFALNIISWLTNSQIDENPGELNLDKSIAPSRWGHFCMNWLFSVILPLLILLTWLWTYWRRVSSWQNSSRIK